MSAKTFFLSNNDGYGGDFLVQLFSRYDNFVPSKTFSDSTHVLDQYGYRSFSNLDRYSDFKSLKQFSDGAKQVINSNNRSIIVESKVRRDVKNFLLPNCLPIRLVSDPSYKIIFYSYFISKLVDKYSTDPSAYSILASRLSRLNIKYEIRSQQYPFEALQQFFNSVYHDENPDRYYQINVNQLYDRPEQHLEEWYDVLEIDNPNINYDIAAIKKYRTTVYDTVVEMYQQKISRTIDPTLGRPWMVRLEDYVSQRLSAVK